MTDNAKFSLADVENFFNNRPERRYYLSVSERAVVRISARNLKQVRGTPAPITMTTTVMCATAPTGVRVVGALGAKSVELFDSFVDRPRRITELLREIQDGELVDVSGRDSKGQPIVDARLLRQAMIDHDHLEADKIESLERIVAAENADFRAHVLGETPPNSRIDPETRLRALFEQHVIAVDVVGDRPQLFWVAPAANKPIKRGCVILIPFKFKDLRHPIQVVPRLLTDYAQEVSAVTLLKLHRQGQLQSMGALHFADPTPPSFADKAVVRDNVVSLFKAAELAERLAAQKLQHFVGHVVAARIEDRIAAVYIWPLQDTAPSTAPGPVRKQPLHGPRRWQQPRDPYRLGTTIVVWEGDSGLLTTIDSRIFNPRDHDAFKDFGPVEPAEMFAPQWQLWTPRINASFELSRTLDMA